ncbi:MAG: sugar ABC transporter ATP-binding protein [Marinisporobacter sp.]|nr:sugar ABC transporter ATP-binding protein [Marinisporobacter sp.]
MNKTYIELKNVCKRFPGVLALSNMNLQLKLGEVHGLIGENGAGKSTLIKVLTGVHSPEEGEIYVDGEKVAFKGPIAAMEKGISCIYQELNTVKELSVADNIFLGRYIKGKFNLLDYEAMNEKTKQVMQTLGQDVDPTMEVGKLGIGQQQMVEIGRALSQDAKVLIMDEPTASLSEKEVQELIKVVRNLKKKGVAILFVSHKLEEIFEICDKVTVMRDGEHIVTSQTEEMTKDSLIANMVGRTLDNLFPKEKAKSGEEILRVENFTRHGVYKDISFGVRRGEIVGFSGLVGAGRTELFNGIFGADPVDDGELYIEGKKVAIKSPKEAIRYKMAFVTEDRKGQGLILDASVKNNLVTTCFKKMKKGIFMDDNKINQVVKENIKSMRIKTASDETPVGQLSGGNQQKVVIGKWLNTDAEIYIFDEPTRGIDVGAKVEVYKLMNELVKKGKAVIMISSELPEILGMSDRVIVMRHGRITGKIDMDSKHFNQEDIMKAAWGGSIDE